MGIKPYLIFSLQDSRYAIAAESVTEIFLLPELILIAEAPSDIIGLLNLHGQFIPVMHLDLRFGRKFDRCHITDSVIIVESQGLQIGVIVNQVETVSDIDDRYIQADLSYGREQKIHQAFIQSVIDLDNETIALLNIDNLVRHPDAIVSLITTEIAETAEIELSSGNFYERYFADAHSSAKKLLQRRAANLRESNEDSAVDRLVSLAIVRIGDNYLALDLDVVREFINIARITTIPCCPPYIIGNMNLRGEILTLIDICQPLNLTVNDRGRANKAVAIEVDEITAGIVVEEIYDVVDFSPDQIKPVPVAMEQDIANYLQGIADYQSQTLKVIDIPQLLKQGAMTVELTA